MIPASWGPCRVQKEGIVGNLAHTREPRGPPPERAGRYLPPNKTARERGYPGSGGSVTIPSTPVLRRARPTRSIGAASPSPLPSSPGYLHPSLSSSPGHPQPYGRLITHRSTAPSALHPDRGPIATPGPCGAEWLHPSSPTGYSDVHPSPGSWGDIPKHGVSYIPWGTVAL